MDGLKKENAAPLYLSKINLTNTSHDPIYNNKIEPYMNQY